MLIVSPLVVVDDLDVPCRTLAPGETDPPLIVYADTVLSASVAVQGFEAVARLNPKIVKLLCRVDGEKLCSRTALDLI